MLIIKPQQLSAQGMEEQDMLKDRKECRKFGPCGVGEKPSI